MYSRGMNELCPVSGSVVLSFQQLLNISARRRFLFVIIHILWALHLYILSGVPHRSITNKKNSTVPTNDSSMGAGVYRLVTSDVFQSAYIKGVISSNGVAPINLLCFASFFLATLPTIRTCFYFVPINRIKLVYYRKIKLLCFLLEFNLFRILKSN